MRILFLISIIGILNSSCSVSKVGTDESFLKTSSNVSKVYLYSISPVEFRRSNHYLNVLILSKSTESNTSITTFIKYQDTHSKDSKYSHYFIDSIQKLNEDKFPLQFISTNFNESELPYYHI